MDVVPDTMFHNTLNSQTEKISCSRSSCNIELVWVGMLAVLAVRGRSVKHHLVASLNTAVTPYY